MALMMALVSFCMRVDALEFVAPATPSTPSIPVDVYVALIACCF